MALDISRKLLGRIDGNTNFAQYQWPVANGVTVTVGDFVYLTGGTLSSATINGDSRPVGMVTETATGNAALTVKANVCIDPQMRYLLKQDNDSGTFAATDIGKYFDLVGATGAQLVDTSTGSATTGVLVCLEYNPVIDPVSADTTYGVFKLVESALYPLGA